MFEGTDTDFIKSKASELIDDPRIGRVTRVYEHLAPEDDSNFEVDVIFDGGASEERSVPYNGSFSGQMAPPRVGDKVVIGYYEGEKKQPFIMDIVYTATDRAPLGRAGMYRDVYESDTSPVGDGDIYLTRYTEYDKNPALFAENPEVDKENQKDLNPERTTIQIAKQADTPDPPIEADIDMRMEMVDAPADNTARVRLSGSQIDGDDSQGLSVELDFKSGEARLTAENANGEFGVKLDSKNGTFTLIDENGYGIESDGNGNFTWHYESIDHSQGTTTSL